jgi:hypothetical protein
MRLTPTALQGSWVQQPIKDMTSFGTDFKTHAIWQGYIEESTANDFVAKKAHTITLSEVQGTNWNVIKCKERLGNHPEAVIRQARIKLDSQDWKSLEDSLPKPYCVDLAETYIMQEIVSLRILSEKKGMICNRPIDVCMRNLWQKAERGKKTGTGSSTRFLQASYFEKRMMCARNIGAHLRHNTSESQRYKKMG